MSISPPGSPPHSPHLDFTKYFPDEITLHIYSFLDLRSLFRLQGLNRRSHTVSSDNTLWQLHWQFETGRLDQEGGNWKERVCSIRKLGRVKPSRQEVALGDSLECMAPWKNTLIYKTRHYGIHIFDLQTMRPVAWINCPHNLNSIVVHEDTLLGVSEKCLYIWDLKKRDLSYRDQWKIFPPQICIDRYFIFTQMGGTISAFNSSNAKTDYYSTPTLLGKQLILGSVRGEWIIFYEMNVIYVYNRNFKYICSLFGHNKAITHVDISGNILCTGSEDKTIKFWDLKKRECFKTLTCEVSFFTLAENKLCAYSLDKKLIIWEFL